MDKEIAKMTIQFLRRVQLSGAEVEAFAVVLNALDEIASKGNKKKAPFKGK